MTRNRAVETLDRRYRYLSRQIDRREAADLPVDWARGERAAIGYALAVIRDAEAIGLHRLGQLTHAERDVLRLAVAESLAAS
jgi:hypothetical protein